MSATRLSTAAPTASSVVAETLREEASTWLFVAKTLLAFFVTGWIAMLAEAVGCGRDDQASGPIFLAAGAVRLAG